MSVYVAVQHEQPSAGALHHARRVSSGYICYNLVVDMAEPKCENEPVIKVCRFASKGIAAREQKPAFNKRLTQLGATNVRR